MWPMSSERKSVPLLRNILLIRIDKIGDLLVSTPAKRNLRQAFPETRITLLTSPPCATDAHQQGRFLSRHASRAPC